MNVPVKSKTKAEARSNGERFFYTGEPCANGHLSKRYASCGNCVECGTWNSRKAIGNSHRNVLRLQRPIIFDSSDYPDPLEFKQFEQAMHDVARQVWAAVKKQRGEPRAPRHLWPTDLRMQAIEGHICFWTKTEDDYWLPMYPDGVLADPRASQHAGNVTNDYFDGGLKWIQSEMKWMVHSPTTGIIGPFMK